MKCFVVMIGLSSYRLVGSRQEKGANVEDTFGSAKLLFVKK